MQKDQEHKYMKGVLAILRGFLFVYTRIFSIRSNISPEVKKLKAPYLLLANHVGTWDPFVVGSFLDPPIHFVSSDAVFRDRFMRMLLTRLGVIPKKKNVKDTLVIRKMISCIRNENCIGLFPEASRSWTGRTMNIDSSTAKLVKLLNVPVVCAKMKGMQLFNPRWGTMLRKTKVEIDFELSLWPEKIKDLSESEIIEIIRKDLYHNEVEYQRKHMNKLHSSFRAEYISYVLFTCPTCNSVGKIESHRNDFHCISCKGKWHIDPYGFFKGRDHKTKFDNIIDWYDWQQNYFTSFIQRHIDAGNSDSIFSDDNMKVFKEKNKGFRRVGKCKMYFFIDRIELHYKNGEVEILNLDQIQTLSPQLRERIEITHDGQAIRIVGKKKGVSGLKWEMACNTVWKNKGQGYKLSTYFK